MRKRGILEIIASVLDCLQAGAMRKTHLTYRSGIDTRTAAKYISFLISCNFIDKSNEDRSLFVITKRGRDFLSIYQNLLLTFGTSDSEEFDMKISSLQA